MAVTVFLITFSGALFCESRLKTVKSLELRAEKSNVIRCHYLCHIASQFVSHNQNDDIQWKILNENMSSEDITILDRKHLGWLKSYVERRISFIGSTACCILENSLQSLHCKLKTTGKCFFAIFASLA